MTDQPVPRPQSENWENEGGGLHAKSEAESLGVMTVPGETFKVGGYSYTNLADAVAQARRMQTQVVA